MEDSAGLPKRVTESDPPRRHHQRGDAKICRDFQVLSVWNAAVPVPGSRGFDGGRPVAETDPRPPKALASDSGNKFDGIAYYVASNFDIADLLLRPRTSKSKAFLESLLHRPDSCRALNSVVRSIPDALNAIVDFLICVVDDVASSQSIASVRRRRARLALLGLAASSERAARDVRSSLLQLPPKKCDSNGTKTQVRLARCRLYIDSILLRDAKCPELGTLLYTAMNHRMFDEYLTASIIESLSTHEQSHFVSTLLKLELCSGAGNLTNNELQTLYAENILVSIFLLISLGQRDSVLCASLLAKEFNQDMKNRILKLRRTEEKIIVLRCFISLGVLVHLHGTTASSEAAGDCKRSCLPQFIAWALDSLLELKNNESQETLNSISTDQDWFAWFVRSAISWGDVEWTRIIMSSVFESMKVCFSRTDLLNKLDSLVGETPDLKVRCLSLHDAISSCGHNELSKPRHSTYGSRGVNDYLSQFVDLLRVSKLKCLFAPESPGDSIWCMTLALKHIHRCIGGFRSELDGVRLEEILNRENLKTILLVPGAETLGLHSMAIELIQHWTIACRAIHATHSISSSTFALIFPSAVIDSASISYSSNVLMSRLDFSRGPSKFRRGCLTIGELVETTSTFLCKNSKTETNNLKFCAKELDTDCSTPIVSLPPSVEVPEALLTLFMALSFANSFSSDWISSKYLEFCQCWNKVPLQLAKATVEDLLARTATEGSKSVCDRWKMFRDSFVKLILSVAPESLLGYREILSPIELNNVQVKCNVFESTFFDILMRLRQPSCLNNFDLHAVLDTITLEAIQLSCQHFGIDAVTMIGVMSFAVVDTILYIEDISETMALPGISSTMRESLVLSLMSVWNILCFRTSLTQITLENAYNCIRLRANGSMKPITSYDFRGFFEVYSQLLPSFRNISEDIVSLFRLPITFLQRASVRLIMLHCLDGALVSSRMSASRGLGALIPDSRVGRHREPVMSDSGAFDNNARGALYTTYYSMQETVLLRLLLELSHIHDNVDDSPSYLSSLSIKGFQSFIQFILSSNSVSSHLVFLQYENMHHMSTCMDALSLNNANFQSEMGVQLYGFAKAFITGLPDGRKKLTMIQEIVLNSKTLSGRIVSLMRLLKILKIYFDRCCRCLALDIASLRATALTSLTFQILVNDVLNHMSPWHNGDEVVGLIASSFKSLRKMNGALATFVAFALFYGAERQLLRAADTQGDSGSRVPAIVSFRIKNKRMVALHLLSLLSAPDTVLSSF